MSLLRKASTETTTIPLGDEGDFIVVRAEIAKRDFNRFISYLPGRSVSEEDKLTPREATELQTGMFEALVTGWSLDVPATVEEYLALETEGAAAIDAALAEHFSTLTPSKQEEKVGFRPEQ